MGAKAGITFDIDISPSPMLFMAEQHALAVDIRSFREPLKRAIQGVLGPSFRHNFEVGGRPSWAPLSEETVRRKAQQGASDPGKILVETGKLARVAGQLNIWEINGQQGEAHVAELPGAEYGAFHQSGFTHHRGGEVPAREFLVIQPQDMDEIEQVFDIWVRERFRRKGWMVA